VTIILERRDGWSIPRHKALVFNDTFNVVLEIRRNAKKIIAALGYRESRDCEYQPRGSIGEGEGVKFVIPNQVDFISIECDPDQPLCCILFGPNDTSINVGASPAWLIENSPPQIPK
jgi:hypothetical protein